MKLKIKATVLEITNETEAFIGTSYADEPFKIVLKELSPLETISIHKKFTKIIDGKEEVDFVNMSVEQLAQSIVSWEGIQDEDGNEIPLNEDNIKQITLYDSEFTGLLLNEFYSIYSKKKK